MQLLRVFPTKEGKKPRRHRQGLRGEEGGSLVEMALICAFVYLPMLIGIMEMAFALYTYNFISAAARQATRYASVRGVQSCTISPTFPDCNLSPNSSANPSSTDGSNALQNYVRGLGYPGIDTSQLTVTATWWSSNITNPGDGTFSYTDWNTQCTGAGPDLFGQPHCNTPGDAVQVVVNYPFTVVVPFIKNYTINLKATSKMVINE